MTRFIIAGALALGLSGCGLFAGETAEHDVFGVGAAYAAVGTAALNYTTLPRCDVGQPAPCSEQGAVDRIKEADNVAFNALKAAQEVARQDPDGVQADLAVSHAFQAVLSMEQLLLGAGVIDEPVAEEAAEEVM